MINRPIAALTVLALATTQLSLMAGEKAGASDTKNKDALHHRVLVELFTSQG